jgi:hypothetical protein
MLYSLIKSRVDLSMAQIDGAEHASRKKQRAGGVYTADFAMGSNGPMVITISTRNKNGWCEMGG